MTSKRRSTRMDNKNNNIDAMYERKTKYKINEILHRQFVSIKTVRTKRLNCFKKLSEQESSDKSSTNEHIMTRKTRTRRPRIHLIQSGYCAVCHIPYNNVEEHIQSKRHQKLIGDDENYISINGFNLHHDSNIDSYLNLNGIDSIVNESELDRDYLPNSRTRSMPKARTRAASVCDRVKPSSLSPTGSDTAAGHHLRSRKNINYMTPPLEEDSLTDIEPVQQECRELRSSTRLLAKLPESDEVWNSGRPKRSCIRQKRTTSTEERCTNQSEIMSTKLRSSGMPVKELQTTDDEKNLIKFKKMRNSELIQLNNEATNFLFPKKDVDDVGDRNLTENYPENNVDEFKQDSLEPLEIDTKMDVCLFSEKTDNSVSMSTNSDTEDHKPINQFKVEDDASMDSNSSDGKRKKKRRTHAEAFIMDNQKYYKFEMPGSRLRYQGTFLSQQQSNSPKSPRNNGESLIKHEQRPSNQFSLDDYKFSFQVVPEKEAWYQAFQRQDRGELIYRPINEELFNSFLLPYQLGPLPPLDPRICIARYNQLMKSPSTSADCSTPDPCTSNSSLSIEMPDTNDEDSKISAISSTISSTTSNLNDDEKKMKKKTKRLRALLTSKNPRKSPRQHASTLAILSSLIQQRKRRSGGKNNEKNLPTIPEKTCLNEYKQYDVLDCDLDEKLLDLDVDPNNLVDFRQNIVTINDIIENRDDLFLKNTLPPPRNLFVNGTTTTTTMGTMGSSGMSRSSRKPGRRKKKKNKTGWPNKNNRSRTMLNVKKEPENSVKDDDSNVDAISVHNIESEDECENETICENSVEQNSDDINDQNIENRVDFNDKVLTNKQTNSSSGEIEVGVEFQPYVCVQKLDSTEQLQQQQQQQQQQTQVVVVKQNNNKRSGSPKRTSRRQRRMPGSPKSPRMLRKPRGKWYRER